MIDFRPGRGPCDRKIEYPTIKATGSDGQPIVVQTTAKLSCGGCVFERTGVATIADGDETAQRRTAFEAIKGALEERPPECGRDTRRRPGHSRRR